MPEEEEPSVSLDDLYERYSQRVHPERRWVRRGDKFVPLDRRFDILERKVNILIIVAVIEAMTVVGQNTNILAHLLKILLG